MHFPGYTLNALVLFFYPSSLSSSSLEVGALCPLPPALTVPGGWRHSEPCFPLRPGPCGPGEHRQGKRRWSRLLSVGTGEAARGGAWTGLCKVDGKGQRRRQVKGVSRRECAALQGLVRLRRMSEWGVAGRQTRGEVWGPHTGLGHALLPYPGIPCPTRGAPLPVVPWNTQTGSTWEGGVNGEGTMSGPKCLLVLERRPQP